MAKTSKSAENKSEKVELKVNEETQKAQVEDKRDIEIENLKNTIAELQEAMKVMLSQKPATTSEKVIVREDEIEIGTYFVQGVGFTSQDESIKISIKAGEVQALTLSEMKKLLRQSEIRKLFEEGVCYFINKEDYAILGIHRKTDLSTANIQRILYSKDFNYIVEELNKVTDYKKNSAVTHCLIYRITDLIRKGELANLDYNTRKGIADYFGLMGFERGIQTLNELDSLKG